MKPAAFHYHAPKTVDEAVALLAEVAPQDGRVLAGGFNAVEARTAVDVDEMRGLG